MFFKQVRRNAMRDRKKNSLYFASMTVAIIAFYTLLSLESQDVMQFLHQVESQAVSKLLAVIPVVYLISLLFVFFLVFFAVKFDLMSRRREFGLYLMLGMKRRRLFGMIFLENLMNSTISLIFGITGAVFLTELISLATVKLTGLGIIAHRFTISFSALLFTIFGYLFVSLFSTLVICIRTSRTEPNELLHAEKSRSFSTLTKKSSMFSLVVGIICLLIAYGIGIFLFSEFQPSIFAIFFFGAVGTFLFYRGFGAIIERRILKSGEGGTGLSVFNSRQLQEQVTHRSSSLAVSSLLLLLAVSFLTVGIGNSLGTKKANPRGVDFTLFCTADEFNAVKNDSEIMSKVKLAYPMELSRVRREGSVLAPSIYTALDEGVQNKNARSSLPSFSEVERIISESAFRSLQEGLGKTLPPLGDNKVALYLRHDSVAEIHNVLNKLLKNGTRATIDGKKYEFLPEIYTDNIVADTAISIYFAVIVPDEVYKRLEKGEGPVGYNLQLKDEEVEKEGLPPALFALQRILREKEIRHESYIQGIGRSLFLAVSGAYLSFYLGFLFLIIANTSLAVTFSIMHEEGKGRYKTLLMLGAKRSDIYASAMSQIRHYFLLVLGLTAVSSIFAIITLFFSMVRIPAGASFALVLGLSAGAFLLLILIEVIYIGAVKKAIKKQIAAI